MAVAFVAGAWLTRHTDALRATLPQNGGAGARSLAAGQPTFHKTAVREDVSSRAWRSAFRRTAAQEHVPSRAGQPTRARRT